MENLILQSFRINWSNITEESYLRKIISINQIEEFIFHKPITLFAGENGSGKSTLIEAIAVKAGFNPEGGTKNYNFSTYDSHSKLSNSINLVRGWNREKWGYYFRAESFYNVASAEEEYTREIGIPQMYHKMSHGESLLSLVQKNFQPNGLYIMDEPESALSPQRQLTLLLEIYKYANKGAQFIIATHSPILLGIPNAEIICFDNGKIHPIPYEKTDSYLITEMFINDRDRLLHHLLC